MSYSIETHSISGAEPGPHLLITGGVHGDEFEPMAAARRLIDRLSPAQLAPQRLRGRVTLAPVVNVPAFRRGQRTADDGLDLARTCPGQADGTITQQVAFALSQLIRSADYYIDLHTGGTRLQVLPLAGYMLHPDSAICESQRRMARAFGLPLIWGSDWRLDGRSLSVARDAQVPAIYCEYQGGGGCDPQGVDAYEHGCLRVLADLGMLSADATSTLPPPASSPIVAEDARPGAGHMQVNLPAPQDGFFEPAVVLGQWVEQDSLFGHVVDVLGRRRAPVTTPHAGLVIVLHQFASVLAGESLGVVLDQDTIISRPTPTRIAESGS
ncbi:MAG: succinylglutamate desuccinylase/aspartoacylase family protein [Pirellulales bacterium]